MGYTIYLNITGYTSKVQVILDPTANTNDLDWSFALPNLLFEVYPVMFR